MITLFSYPPLFGVADNNGYGLKVFAFLKLNKVPFVQKHVFDASDAPRGQLPYVVDGDETVGDSSTIVAHLTSRYRLAMNEGLSQSQHDMNHLIERMLDDLYWVMSYSRWKDDLFWPAFMGALLREHPNLTEAALMKARAFNADRYHYQGIGRYSPEAAYARGIADLQVLSRLVPATGFVHGQTSTSVDASIYGFVANIYYSDIETPLRNFVVEQRNLVEHCKTVHAAVSC